MELNVAPSIRADRTDESTSLLPRHEDTDGEDADRTVSGEPPVEPTAPAPPLPPVPSRVLQDRYQIGDLLGRGGMGDVYAAMDTRLGRQVAVKILSPAAARIPGSRERFEQEARLAAGLSHPNVVGVYDSGEDDGDAFIVMELLEGGTLSEILVKGPLAPRAAVRMGEDLLSALSAAHEHELLHRDVKPGNVISSEGRWKVADFGIAKTLSGASSLTSTGLIVGTAAYLPPEILSGRSASVRSDLWAAAAVLYEALCGCRPYAFAPDHANALTVPLVPLSERAPSLPAELAALVDRGLAADPEERYSSAEEMLADLQRVALLLPDVDSPTEVVAIPPPAPPSTTGGTPVPVRTSRAGLVLFWTLVVLLMVSAAVGGYVLTSS